MLVQVNNPVAVGPTNDFGEIYTVVDNDDDAGNGLNATGLTPRGTLAVHSRDAGARRSRHHRHQTRCAPPTPPAAISIRSASRSRSTAALRPGSPAPDVNPGAKLDSVTGVVSYNFANYEVVATQAFTVAQASTLVKETTSLVGTATKLSVASYNAENLDALDPAARFTTIADEVKNRLNSPDIIALQEIQDNDGAANSSTTAADETLQELVDAINAIAPGRGALFLHRQPVHRRRQQRRRAGRQHPHCLPLSHDRGSTSSPARCAPSAWTASRSADRTKPCPMATAISRPNIGEPILRLAAAAGRHLPVQRQRRHHRQQPFHLEGRQRRVVRLDRAAAQRQRSAARGAGAGGQQFRRQPARRRPRRQGHRGRRPQRVPVGRADPGAQGHGHDHQLRRARQQRSVRRHRDLHAGRHGDPGRPAGDAAGERAVRLLLRRQRPDARSPVGHRQPRRRRRSSTSSASTRNSPIRPATTTRCSPPSISRLRPRTIRCSCCISRTAKPDCSHRTPRRTWPRWSTRSTTISPTP